MPDFSFLDGQPERRPPWSHADDEHIDTGLIDGSGRVIGFRVCRAVLDDGTTVKHARTISVTHNGEPVRSDSSYHDTFEAAEDRVNAHIKRSMQRYRATYGQNVGPIFVNTRSATKPAAVANLAKSMHEAGSRMMGCGCAMVLLALMLLLPFLLLAM